MIIRIDGVSQGYGDKTVVREISFEAVSGDVITILGPNGCGKSTLIKTICNIIPPRNGTVSVDGVDVATIEKLELAKMIGYVPQNTMVFGYTSVFDTVLLGRRPYVKWSYTSNDISIAVKAMDSMNITDLHDKYISELSGGQKQRVHLARSIAQDPGFFVLDEPTSSLDLRHQIDTMEFMFKMATINGKGVIVAMHDLNLAMKYSTKVLVLKDSKIYDFGKPDDVITDEMIRDVYGVIAEVVDGKNGRYVQAYGSMEKG